jgi:hypothetical protein
MQTNIIDGLKADNNKLVTHITKLQIEKSNYQSIREQMQEKFRVRGKKLKYAQKKLTET